MKLYKSGFLSELEVKECNRVTGNFELTDDLVYIDEHVGLIIVPTGFCTDFASVPKALRWLIDDDEYVIRAPAVIHDYLYSEKLSFSPVTRKESDQTLRRAMLKRGASQWKANLAYAGVRAFGWIWFRNGNKQ